MPETQLNLTTNAAFIPTIIAQKALGRLPAYLNVANTISRDSDWTTATVGQTVQVAKRGAVVATDHTSGTASTKQAPTATNVSVTLNKWKEVVLPIDDLTKICENQDTQMGYAEDGAIALAEKIETDLLDLHTLITNTRTWDRSSATTIDNSMLSIRKFFVTQRVPQVEPRYFQCDPTIYNDLLGTDKYSRYDATGQQGQITQGRMIPAYGFQVFESQVIPTSGSPVAYHNIAYTKNGLVLANRALPRPQGFGGYYAVVNAPSVGLSLRSMLWYDPEIKNHVISLDLVYGVAVLDDRRVLEVESF
jgi:hypothetical protein